MSLSTPQRKVIDTRAAPRLGRWWDRRERSLAPYLYVAPFLLLYLLFFAYPVVSAFYLSMFRRHGYGRSSFVGLGNYASLLSDDRFVHSLGNTTYYAAGSLFVLSPLALLIALALNWPRLRLKGLYRLLFFLPFITSAVVVALMFYLVFDKTYGLLNTGLGLFGIPHAPWLESTSWSMTSILILGIWTYVGVNALFFLAGLQNVDRELQDAARIDGANVPGVFWHVTVPQLRPVILFVAVQAIVGSYNLFAQPFVLTQGGPEDSSLTMTLYLYVEGFQFGQLGYAASIGFAIAVIIIIVSTVQLWVLGAFRED